MTDHWYIAKQARGHMKKYGPMSFQQLRNLAGAGKLQPTDLLCQEGMESWLPAKEVEGLFPRGGPALSPLPPGASVHASQVAGVSPAPLEGIRLCLPLPPPPTPSLRRTPIRWVGTCRPRPDARL